MALASASTFSGFGCEDSEWRRRTTKGVLPDGIEIWASLLSMFLCLRLLLAQRARRVGCRIYCRWAYALRSGVCADRRRTRRTASDQLDVAMQSAFQENCSYTMAVRGLLDGGSVMVHRVRALAVAN